MNLNQNLAIKVHELHEFYELFTRKIQEAAALGQIKLRKSRKLLN